MIFPRPSKNPNACNCCNKKYANILAGFSDHTTGYLKNGKEGKERKEREINNRSCDWSGNGKKSQSKWYSTTKKSLQRWPCTSLSTIHTTATTSTMTKLAWRRARTGTIQYITVTWALIIATTAASALCSLTHLVRHNATPFLWELDICVLNIQVSITTNKGSSSIFSTLEVHEQNSHW
jgi:hypothetical protein